MNESWCRKYSARRGGSWAYDVFMSDADGGCGLLRTVLSRRMPPT